MGIEWFSKRLNWTQFSYVAQASSSSSTIGRIVRQVEVERSRLSHVNARTLSTHGKLCCRRSTTVAALSQWHSDLSFCRKSSTPHLLDSLNYYTVAMLQCRAVHAHTHTHSTEVRFWRYGSKTDLNLAKKSLRGEDTFPAVSSSPSNRLHNTFCTKFAKHAHISHGHSTRDPFRYAHIRIQILWQQLMRHFSPHSIHSSLSRHPSVR